MLPGCSNTSTQTPEKKAEQKPPEPIGGLEAVYSMYRSARNWAADAQVLKLNSINLPEVKAVPGKCAAWQAKFTSASKGKARSWTYSVIEAQGNLHQGVFGGLEEVYAGPQGLTKPFLIAAIKTDSVAAYETALKQTATPEYNTRNPGKHITFLLESTKQFPDAAWRVIWGESLGTSNYSVMVDATTGAFLEIIR